MKLKVIQLFSNPILKKGLFLIIFSMFFWLGYTQSNILDKTIEVPEFSGKARELLIQIEQKDTILFAFSSNVPLDFEVSFQKKTMKLNDFLVLLFENKSVGYKSKGNKIILYIDKSLSNSQKLSQIVRGTVIDEDSQIPLIGAAVYISETDPVIGTITDVDGNFKLENVTVGRINLHLSYMGYDELVIPNIEVNSGKEVVLSLKMRESVLGLDEAVITTGRRKGEGTNDLSVLSARSISIEETKRYTGGMDDPARMVTSYAGVSASNGSSDIIVRGNSPKYMQWRLDGIEIASPYHMDDQNSTYGALTALNKSLLTSSNFNTGAFSPEYGNVLSNVMDMRLRSGNNEKFEATFGIGLMGTDITMEGPLKKGYGGSYLVNYRYSTVSALDKLGLLPGVEGIVNYQDATFKVVLPTKKAGTFSVFGLGGMSGFAFKNVGVDGATTIGRLTDASILKDFDKDSYLSNIGITHTLSLTNSSYIKTSLAYSPNGINDDLYEKTKLNEITSSEDNVSDSVSDRKQTFKSRVESSMYQTAVTYNNKINARHKIQIGTRFLSNNSNYSQDIYREETDGLSNVTDFDNSVNSLNNFVSWKFNMTKKLTLVSGVHNMYVLLNQKSTLEPRIALTYQLNESSSFNIGFGKYSTHEKPHNYFTKVQQTDGTFTQPNKDLGLLKADHYVAGFKKYFNENLLAKLEIYYQNLYDLPVENNDTSYYSTINEGNDYQYVSLVNKGVGKNYGIELTLERFFDNNYYFVVNGSLYESKYKSLDGVWRNTMYNGNYMVNFLCGKEFRGLGKKGNKTLAVNFKSFVGGSQRYIPLLRDSEGNVVADPEKNQYWDYSKAFDNKLVHVYNVNTSISYKINRSNSTHEIFLDLMNILHSNAKITEYYDESSPDKVGYEEQMVFIPNIMYRVYF